VNTGEQNSETSYGQTLNSEFGDLYIAIRNREKRVFNDAQLMFLPDIEPSHIHYKEWQVRKHSSQRLIDYLKRKNRPLKILEIGCGNGWLSSRMSAIPGSKVIGLDINEIEIAQAKRVLKKNNLEFVCATFHPEMFRSKFDIILFAASISYFPAVRSILQDALSCLADDGEIHIIDTPFFRHNEIVGAALRSNDYFKMLGYPEMSGYYHHHPISDIEKFNYKLLVNPLSLVNRIKKTEYFYWISISH
jgi:2-polyprenyl-3-methyl-5-hydroxy-6-metoxy-1,4-benzoquinol methylase